MSASSSRTSLTARSAIITLSTDENSIVVEPPVLRLRLHNPKSEKKVQWTETTVDNEHMNKKKSKCCCIYVKPRVFGESSSESEDECENCFGHVELKNKHKSAEPPKPKSNPEDDHSPPEDPKTD